MSLLSKFASLLIKTINFFKKKHLTQKNIRIPHQDQEDDTLRDVHFWMNDWLWEVYV